MARLRTRHICCKAELGGEHGTVFKPSVVHTPTA
jgi:hypothetical protein